ncbi:steryl acetyl hydrolase [Roseococcus sp. SYP-B2431]|uniref:alpha/beta hydrolase n=1 Tax=Roseococcus sp. SYP-B2431 TaxID=2496640 RepID=UPI00103C040E|nr:alpha/beta hydrolase [Roseococcus sp. SYP-B2431]TCI00901.1 steryl acetyl hydrolase [Roseococcus sp. SYP-B2431]
MLRPPESGVAPSRRLFLGSVLGALPTAALADPAASVSAPRRLPARLLPVPATASPALRAAIGAPFPPGWDSIPRDAAGWRALQAQSAATVAPHLPALRQHLKVQVEATRIAGVPAFVITPEDLPAANRDRLLVHLHGGGYVLYPGEAGAGEGMMMAGYGRFRVVSIDYRMAPDFPFPAALDDSTAVWRALAARHDPRRMAIFGASAGGGLTLALILRARAEGLPLPAAIAPGTPWCDLAGAGDSLRANEFVDNVLVSADGWVGAAARLYANGRDLRDPLISPIYGDFAGFPPAILTSGTRDLLLSDTVRAHRRLRQAGVEAVLQVFEGQSHAQYLLPGVPETQEAFAEIALFFQRHLA